MDLKPYLVKSSRSLKGSSINNYMRNIKTLHSGKPFEECAYRSHAENRQSCCSMHTTVVTGY